MKNYNKIKQFFYQNQLDYLDVNDWLTEQDFEDIDFSNAFEGIYHKLKEQNAFDIEIVYYNKAIDYLNYHDPSLTTSLCIANELGYKLSDINSELLASLLASSETESMFFEMEADINEFFANLD